MLEYHNEIPNKAFLAFISNNVPENANIDAVCKHWNCKMIVRIAWERRQQDHNKRLIYMLQFFKF